MHRATSDMIYTLTYKMSG